ncbi:hypothetical protein KTQ42_17450|nr:hypothetical protein [Noviherbaspirillum sp. L7-7A]MBV0881085.1 hypothetical protein [Noviherbaspirillum sp. L7-7A]
MQSTTSEVYSLKQFFLEEDGMSFIECALVASLVAVVGGIAILAFGKL